MAGNFSVVAGQPATRIAKWDGANWIALGAGFNDVVSSLAVVGTNLYAAGRFTMSGQQYIRYIARWDGTNWSPLGSGTSAQVNALAVIGNDLYVGGDFAAAGSAGSRGIARWDGAAWFPAGFGVDGSFPYVFALAASGTNLYVGGSFTYPANKIAKWDGVEWTALDSGMTANIVWALAASGDDVYAGYVTAVAGFSTGHVAKWTQGAWSELGSGFGGGSTSNGSYIYSLALGGGELYVGGDFSLASIVPANHVAKWDGGNWSALGAGMNGPVRALAAPGGDLHTVGEFTVAGGKVSAYWATWNLGLQARVVSVSRDGMNFTARIGGKPGVTYTIERSPGLSLANWQKHTNLTAPTNDLGYGIGVFELRDPIQSPQRLYRAVYPGY